MSIAKVLTILTLLGALIAAGSVQAGSSAPSTITYTMDAPRTLLGPSSQIDNSAFTLGQYLYVGNVSTQVYSIGTGGSLTLVGTAISGGDPNSGAFDNCGAWLDSGVVDASNPALIRAWYHAEYAPAGTACAGTHRMSVGYAESTDGGRTFTKPGYPNNQVISAPPSYTDPAQGSEGQQYVRVGQDGYYYLYFQAVRDSWTVHVARALISSGGTPGSWQKLLNGVWTSPGLGGDSNHIAVGTVLGRTWVDYSSALGQYVGLSWSTTGFGLAESPDGISGWQVVISQILATTHSAGGSSAFIDYPSLLGMGLTTGQGLGADFEVMYMYVPPNQPIGSNRELHVQTLHLQGGTPTPVATSTATPIPAATATATGTATPTATSTATVIPTATATATPAYIDCRVRKRTSDGTIEIVCP